MRSRFRAHQVTKNARIHYGFLYGDREKATKAAEGILEDNGVRFKKVSLRNTPQLGMNFVAPTFITREGTFRGLDAIEAYLGWFVNDPEVKQLSWAR